MQLANVFSDVSGMTGQLIRPLWEGERNPHELAAFRDWRVKASEEEIARTLEDNWQEDLLFVLEQEQESYEFCQKQMAHAISSFNNSAVSRGLQLRSQFAAGDAKKNGSGKRRTAIRLSLAENSRSTGAFSLRTAP